MSIYLNAIYIDGKLFQLRVFDIASRHSVAFKERLLTC